MLQRPLIPRRCGSPLRFLLVLATCLVLPLSARAILLTVNNPSFESPGAAGGVFVGGTSTGPTNWTVYNTGSTGNTRFFGVWNPATTTSFIDPVPSGTNIGVVFLDDNAGREAGLRQTLAATLQISTQYTLTVAVGNFRPSVGSVATASTERFYNELSRLRISARVLDKQPQRCHDPSRRVDGYRRKTCKNCSIWR